MNDSPTQNPNEIGLMPIAVNLFKAPSSAFEQIKTERAAWFPLLLTILFAVLITIVYFNAIDFNWYIEEQVLAAGANKSPAEQEIIRSSVETLGLTGSMIIRLIAIAVILPLSLVLTSVVLLVASNIRNDSLTFGDCFCISSWSNLVILVSMLFSLIILMMTDGGNIPLHTVSGINANLVLFQLELTNPWYGFMSQLDLIFLWVGLLRAFGYRAFTKASMTASMIIGFLPSVLFIVISAVITSAFI